eukprot:TRINITY_DN126_c0_g1_i2.p1 TRINITY_DN126_c0_g1~~TRINITY_DN126_c0_g1_i2.p1  ORF type:complete len:311 (-),score=19.27 TRINITY_DN126_c0_g1_i2:120-1052(-)
MLGGLEQQRGVNALDQEWTKELRQRRTTASYLVNVAERVNSENPEAIDLIPYLTSPCSFNPYIPPNLRILAGDPDLQELDRHLHSIANKAGITWNQHRNFVELHLSLQKSLQLLNQSLPSNLVVFIDTNPAFTAYTAIGICAAKKIITPVKADDYSKIAAKSMISLIYGPSGLASSFAQQASLANNPPGPVIILPKIQLVIANQLTSYQGAAKAYRAMSVAICNQLYEIYRQRREVFAPKDCADLDAFDRTFFTEVHDMNTNGVAAAHNGVPIYHLASQTFNVETIGVRINRDQAVKAQQYFSNIIAKLN